MNEKTSAATSAAQTVFAIGAKMRPSTRWSEKIGTYATMMMAIE